MSKNIFSILLLLFSLGFSANNNNQKHILILHSYHPGYIWSDNINKSLLENLQQDGQGKHIFVEYLDAMRNSSPKYIDLLDKVLREKYLNRDFNIDLIIACDDNALKFLDSRPQLFDKTQIVFCGINNYEKANFPHLNNLTGVNEAISVDETIDLALKIRPQATKMAVVTGSSLTAKRNLEIFKNSAPRFKDKIKISYLTDLEPEELEKKLAEFNEEDIIVYLSYLTTPKGKNFTVSESINLITNDSQAAIFGFWDFLLPDGVIGGKVVHAESQAELAAKLASRVLSGTPANTIPVIMESPNRFIFNGSVLEKYNILPDSLPKKAIIMNRSAKGLLIDWDKIKINSFFGYDLFAKHGSIMMLLDPVTGTILDANQSANDFYGYNELAGKNISDINPMPPEQMKIEMATAKRLGQNHFNFLHRRADGSIRNVSVYSYPMEVMGTQILFSILNDVTEQVNAQKNIDEKNKIILGIFITFLVIQLALILLFYKKNLHLKKAKYELLLTQHELVLSEQKYRKLFDAMPVGCALHEMLIDQNGKAADYRFINLNPAFEKLTGMDNSAVTGKTLKEVLPVSEHQFVDFYAPVALEGKNIFFEQYSSALNKHFEIFAYSPQPGMFVTMFNDITSRKTAEEIIKNINIELEEKVKERTADLTFANKELEAFSYSVSHDLRAPLRAIEGFSTALFEDYYTQIDQTGQDYLQRIRKAANHMSQLIDDFLNLSRISRKELEIVEINLSNLVTETAINLKKSEQNRDIELVIQPNLQATGDITTLTILINQLLTNAFKFTINKPKAIIKFGQTTKNGEDYYYIEDNGAGFDQNYADKLFTPFQRLHSNSEFPGTGIGLAIAQRIIIKHGGKIFAEGKVDQGASFYFKI